MYKILCRGMGLTATGRTRALFRHVSGIQALICFAVMFLVAHPASGMVVRRPIEKGVYALLNKGRSLYLECSPPPGDGGQSLLERYLADERAWKKYAGKSTVAIAFAELKPAAQRVVVLAIFPEDAVDERGWTHVVCFADDEQGRETLWSLSEWLTGSGTHYRAVMAANNLKRSTLRPGQKILVPAKLLREGMQAVPRSGPLTYEDRYAVYQLKPKETLYTSVVLRFTDCRDNASIVKACKTVQLASGIKNPDVIKVGAKVRIPIDMLSARFKPPGNPAASQARLTFEEARAPLAGKVLVLDPGHGGRDHGARNSRYNLYEDEVSYDLACRIKRLLESTTEAKVCFTIRDRSQGYMPVDYTRFRHDKDEDLLTTPPYTNRDAHESAHLRWYLANSLYRKEILAGTDPKDIIFASIHCDARPKDQRGVMVYIPGARYRRDREAQLGKKYERYKEVREQPYARSTEAERKRDEALSWDFAEDLMESFGRHRVRRHLDNAPIRLQIHNGGKEFVPAVLRNTVIPTKVLVEAVNLTNATDCTRVADPSWRERFAEAFVDGLKQHFGS